MATEQELDQAVARTNELLKELDECRKLHERSQQQAEDFARQLGVSNEELVGVCQQAVEHVRTNGSPEEKKMIAELEAKTKQAQENDLAQIKAEVAYQSQSAAAGKPKRMHNLI